VAALSKELVCGRSLAGIVGSNPAGAWKSVCYECCVLSGRGLCFGLHTCPEESYLVCVCVIMNHRQRGGLGPLGLSHQGKKLIGNPVMGTVILESVL